MWLRIRGDVFGLIVEREGGRLSWYHRQLKETAEERFGSNKVEKTVLHTLMAKYFSNAYFEKEDGEGADLAISSKLPISKQPLVYKHPNEFVWLSTAHVNKRFADKILCFMRFNLTLFAILQALCRGRVAHAECVPIAN